MKNVLVVILMCAAGALPAKPPPGSQAYPKRILFIGASNAEDNLEAAKGVLEMTNGDATPRPKP